MKINDIIRSRRQALGLTQEGLAEKLGVSAPAVNKWEKALNYPDITLLPTLARILGVDLNTLLSFQEDMTQEEVGLFLGQLYQVSREEGCAAAFDLARDKVRQFPNNDILAYSAAGLLEGILTLWPGGDEGAQARWEGEIAALYERSAASADPRIREWACYTLAGRCISNGELDRAQALLDQLSDTHRDKRTLTAALRRREGNMEEAWTILERDLFDRAHSIQTTLLHLIDLALAEGDMKRAQALCDTAVKSGRDFYLSDYAVLSAPFQLATAEKDGPKALNLLERLLHSLTVPLAPKTSHLYPHLPAKEGWAESQVSLIQPILDELEQDPDSAFLRKEPGYRKLVEKYRNREI